MSAVLDVRRPGAGALAAAGDGAAYVNVSQASALLGVSRVTLWRWIRGGRLPAARLGHRTVRIKHQDLERLVAERAAQGPQSWPSRSLAVTAAPVRHPAVELLPALDHGDALAGADEHFVQFYETDAFLLDAVREFIEGALRAGDAGIVVATAAHREGLEQRLAAEGLDLDAARAAGRYVSLDAAETLSQFMLDGVPDPWRFADVVGGLIARAQAGGRRVRIFGEMVALLVDQDNHAAAIRLEQLWNDFQQNHSFSLLCGYPIDRFGGEALAEVFGDVCQAHSHVVPAESYTARANGNDRLRGVAGLQQKARSLEAEIARRTEVERRLSLQYAVTRVLADAETLREATVPIIQAVCEHLHWDAGSIWSVDAPGGRAGRLRCDDFWHVPELPPADVAPFETATRARTFKLGVGLPGRVWASRQPAWIPAIADDANFLRADEAARAGLRAAFGFPIRAGDDVLGVIEFFSRDAREPGDDLLALLTATGSQIGQFIQRRRAESARALLLERERAARQEAEERNASQAELNVALREVAQQRDRALAATEAERQRLAEHAAELRQRARQAELGATVGASLTKGETLPAQLQRCTEALVQHLDAAFARIWTLNEAEQLLELQASAGLYTHLDGPHSRVPVGAFKIGRIAQDRRPHLTNDVLGDDSRVSDPAWARREGMLAFAGYPLLVGDRLVGVMAMFARHPLPETTLLALGSVADTIAIGIDRAAADAERDRLLRLAQAARADNARLYEQAQAALRTRDEFLSAAAHDLRTPLASMKGYAQLLSRQAARAGALTPPRLAEGLGHIETSATRMDAMVEDLLDVARVQDGQPVQLRRRPTDLAALARRAVETHQPSHSRHRLRVECADHPDSAGNLAERVTGEWDAARLERVLDNLIGNAIKYSPDGGDIVITLACDDGGVVLTVQDHGVGIPATDLPHVFERFRRGRNVAGKIAGSGIGLASVKRIVEQHGGSISVASQEGHGSTFTVRLPAGTAH